MSPKTGFAANLAAKPVLGDKAGLSTRGRGRARAGPGPNRESRPKINGCLGPGAAGAGVQISRAPESKLYGRRGPK